MYFRPALIANSNHSNFTDYSDNFSVSYGSGRLLLIEFYSRMMDEERIKQTNKFGFYIEIITVRTVWMNMQLTHTELSNTRTTKKIGCSNKPEKKRKKTRKQKIVWLNRMRMTIYHCFVVVKRIAWWILVKFLCKLKSRVVAMACKCKWYMHGPFLPLFTVLSFYWFVSESDCWLLFLLSFCFCFLFLFFFCFWGIYEYLFWRRSLRVLDMPDDPGSGSFSIDTSCLAKMIFACSSSK